MHEKISRPFRIMNIRTPFIRAPYRYTSPGRCQDKNRKSQPFTPTVCDGIFAYARQYQKQTMLFCQLEFWLTSLTPRLSISLILSLYCVPSLRLVGEAPCVHKIYVCIPSYEKTDSGILFKQKRCRVKLTKLKAHAGSRLFLLFNATRHRASAVIIIFNK